MPSPSTSREWSNRRFGALLAAILWLVGFELVPSVHSGFHDWFGHHHHGDLGQHGHDDEPDQDALAHDDHAHGDQADGGHAHDGHAHDGHDVEHHEHAEEPDPLDEAEDSEALACVRAPSHGNHSLAHRGVVAIDPPPVLPPVTAAAFRRAKYRLPAGQPPRDAQPTTVRSRGPPSA